MSSIYEKYLGHNSEKEEITINNPFNTSQDTNVYNFDVKCIHHPNKNPGVLFSNTYDNDDRFRSSFILNKEDLDQLIKLLQQASENIQKITEYNERLNIFKSHLRQFYYAGILKSIDIKYMKSISTCKEFSTNREYINNTFVHKFNVHVNFVSMPREDLFEYLNKIEPLAFYPFDPRQENYNFNIYTNIRVEPSRLLDYFKSLLDIDYDIPVKLINIKKGMYHDAAILEILKIRQVDQLLEQQKIRKISNMTSMPIPVQTEEESFDTDQFAKDLKELIQDMKGEDSDVSDEVSEDERKF